MQMALKIHDPLKGKAYLKASLLTSKWLRVQTDKEMETPGDEKLTPVKCCRMDSAVAGHHAVY